ncbi:MAG: hypothetical protein WEA56_05625 [Balneolaceae bacterium]
MNFEQIKLEEEQKELFIRIVEARRKAPRDQWEFMYIIKGYPDLTIPAKSQKEIRIKDIIDGDLEELVIKGLLRLKNETTHEMHFIIPKEGFLYYEWLMQRQGEPVERIEKHTFLYIEASHFRNRYSETYKRLKEAEEMLWSSDSSKEFTTIGHKCREAMQEFADRLYSDVIGEKSDELKSRDKNRIKAVIEVKKENYKLNGCAIS